MEYTKQLQGLRANMSGKRFERMLEVACDHYRHEGLAKIEKTPEPMKPLRRPNNDGRFLACYTKQAQPDFGGTICGGRSIVFEAKHTDSGRIEQERLTREQMEDLEAHYIMGAYACVMVSLSFQQFYRVPWPVWREMKPIYGRKYITREELEQYKLRAPGGIIRFLDGLLPQKKVQP